MTFKGEDFFTFQHLNYSLFSSKTSREIGYKSLSVFFYFVIVQFLNMSLKQCHEKTAFGDPCKVRSSRRGTGGPDPPPPPEKSQNIGFLSNTGPDPLKNHKATKTAFNVGPSSASQRNAI